MKAVIKGLTVGYTDQGNGTPLVFVHAFPLSKTMWQPQVDALKDTYRLITIDLPGHGESDIVLWNDTLDGYAKVLSAYLIISGLLKPCLWACRWAGIPYFRSIDIMPNRVHAMVLADTRAQADSEEGKAGRRSMAQVAFSDGAPAIADLMLPKLLAPSTIEHHPEIVEQVRQMILQTSTAGIVVDLVAMAARPDSTDLLPTITCPTLVIVGEDDVATPVSESHYMAERIAGSTLVTIPGAGHLSNFEQPAAFNEALQSFLTTHRL